LFIRTATEDDWPAIWPFWREIVEAGETYAYPVGSAKMGPNRPGRGAHVGTASFMGDPAARGRGVGRMHGEHVVAWHREQGFAGVQFNAVVETNRRRAGAASASRDVPRPLSRGRGSGPGVLLVKCLSWPSRSASTSSTTTTSSARD
jgi:GNAT superfamily N-acetyltransferase